tara:strand:+ start:251 stop:352 length:102 start_codon:yes stop_codon:yes gene_type:complete
MARHEYVYRPLAIAVFLLAPLWYVYDALTFVIR